MRIRVGNFVLSLGRINGRESQNGGLDNGSPLGEKAASGIALADIKSINDAYVKYISGLSTQELQSRAAEVTVAGIDTPDGLAHARRVLEEHGIVIIPSMLGAGDCLRAQEAIESVCRKYSSSGQESYETEDLLYQSGPGRLQGYYQLSNYDKTVFQVRKGQDEGMIDIFNCDFAFPREFSEVRRVFEREDVQSLLSYKSLKPKNLNTYVNQGIQRTRGFHVDSYSEQIKAFVYMTDVTDLADGPYTFVKRSHKESPFRRANRKLCDGMTPATEAPILDPAAITPVLARRGAMIVSDQSGVHRGWPQQATGRRLVAVMNYK